jgi:hypothetical protein
MLTESQNLSEEERQYRILDVQHKELTTARLKTLLEQQQRLFDGYARLFMWTLILSGILFIVSARVIWLWK